MLESGCSKPGHQSGKARWGKRFDTPPFEVPKQSVPRLKSTQPFIAIQLQMHHKNSWETRSGDHAYLKVLRHSLVFFFKQFFTDLPVFELVVSLPTRLK